LAQLKCSPCKSPHLYASPSNDDTNLIHLTRGPVRDALIYHMRDWLSQLGKANWSINWPFDQTAAIEHDLVTNIRRLTAKFIAHIRKYDNWSVSREFLQAFPELSGRIRVHD
jgi:hypothetical protein